MDVLLKKIVFSFLRKGREYEEGKEKVSERWNGLVRGNALCLELIAELLLLNVLGHTVHAALQARRVLRRRGVEATLSIVCHHVSMMRTTLAGIQDVVELLDREMRLGFRKSHGGMKRARHTSHLARCQVSIFFDEGHQTTKNRG